VYPCKKKKNLKKHNVTEEQTATSLIKTIFSFMSLIKTRQA